MIHKILQLKSWKYSTSVVVKEFAQKTANSARSDGKKCPNYKLIILDEADSMTKSAQEALRRTMEVYRKIFISFILV